VTTSARERTTVDLDESWSIGDKIHGGYLLAQVVRATLEGGGYPDPLGVSARTSRSNGFAPVAGSPSCGCGLVKATPSAPRY
jgi:hypothetical protein